MAFLGSIGKAFGISTPEAANIAASFAQGGFPAAAVTTFQSLGEPKVSSAPPSVDVSAPPAGVDSPATLTNVSQTSRTLDIFANERPGMLGGARPTPNQAFIGGFGVPGLVSQAGRLLSRPSVGGALVGAGGAIVGDFVTDMFGNTKKLVITRKLQREVKKVFMMSGGDIGFVSMNSMMLFGKDLSQDQILMILFKTFKNQGPFVTKAAVRKTRSTIRKMETLCDLKDRLCPPKRAAPRRRTMGSTTKVLQVK